MKNEDTRQSVFSFMYSSLIQYMKKNYRVVILVLVSFLLTTALNFVKISTATTVSSINVENYEVGQISDITIIARRSLPPTVDHPVEVQEGERVIREGFPITQEGYAKLQYMASSPAYLDYRAFADSIIFHVLLAALFFLFYSKVYFKDTKIEFKELVLGTSCYILIFACVIFGQRLEVLSRGAAICAVIPASLCVDLIAIMFGQLDSVFFAVLISLNVLNAASYQLVPFLFVLATTLCSARLVRRIDRRGDMILVSVLQAVLNTVFLIIFKIIFNDTLRAATGMLIGVALNGFFSGILCLGLLTPLELLLNTASPFRLMDLSDLNSPLMRKLLLVASGTYSHSLMVANLAEAACNEIGANALLARVGAYYHDIGKMDNPEYFVENQRGENAHDDINPSLSVSIIRSHVRRGVEKARALRFPKQIVDIISEHHGNQVIAYFYNQAKTLDPDANPEDYSYTGSPPTTRESGVVMLADTVEAACRTLDKPSVSRLEKFIKTLIDGKIEQKQLDNCDLSFKDIAKIQDAFVQILAGYYHSRTKYPDQKDPDTNVSVYPAEQNKTLALPDSDSRAAQPSASEGVEVSSAEDKTGQDKEPPPDKPSAPPRDARAALQKGREQAEKSTKKTKRPPKESKGATAGNNATSRSEKHGQPAKPRAKTNKDTDATDG